MTSSTTTKTGITALYHRQAVPVSGAILAIVRLVSLVHACIR